MWMKQFKPWKLLVVGSIVVTGVLTRVLIQSMCDSKAAQMNMQQSNPGTYA